MISCVVFCTTFIISYYLLSLWRIRRISFMMKRFRGPPVLPVIGNGLLFMGLNGREMLRRSLSIMDQYHNPIRLWLFHIPYVVITDPEDFQIVSMKVLEKDNRYRFLADLIGDGLITAKETAMGYSKDFDNMETVARLKDNTTKASLLAGQRFYQPWLQPSIIFKLYMLIKGWSNVFEESKVIPLKILKLKRQTFLEDKAKNITNDKEKSYKSFIDILMNTHEAKHFTDKDVADEVLTIMFAATETSALITSFTLLMLAMKPDIQEKVYVEILETFENSDRPMMADDLNKLPFLDQCIKESLRLFAAVPIVIRHTVEDLPISNGNVIPAGANIILAIFGVHQNPDLYPNPKVWNPYNFDADKVAARHPCAFVPFGVGPRMCIGYKQSLVAITTQLAAVLRKFKLSTDETDYELDVDFLIRSARGFKIKLEYRNKP